jgi:three-Cys-motif partner protein
MVKKSYSWREGAVLDEHSRRKHKILREYLVKYLETRCRLLHQSLFRVAVVDGFAGGGRYSDGSPGSPIIILEAVREGAERINLWRRQQGMQPVRVACEIILNDDDAEAFECLKSAVAPVLGALREEVPEVTVNVEFFNKRWEELFPGVVDALVRKNFRNVIFNLDQYGHSTVSPASIEAIMARFASPEVFLTFAIQSWLTFLQTTNPEQLALQLQRTGVRRADLEELQGAISNQATLGVAEKLVFASFKERASYVSPFSIHNPEGWRYWMMHFARSQRARQVYNDVLHENSSNQAHYGRSGLNMLSYSPKEESGFLYLFDRPARERAREQLLDDIPRFVSGAGDALLVGEFYEQVYNETPAHADDIKAAMIESPEIEVRSETGNLRRKPHQIGPSDVIRFNKQGHFFDIIGRRSKPKQS